MESPKKNIPNRSSVDVYRRTDVMTANRESILLMMYSGAIRFLRQAISAEEKKDWPERARLIGRAQEIINELRATLNFDAGGEIAKNLDNLYLFITDRLLVANAEKSAKPLEEALKVLITLNSAWEEAVASLKKNKSENSANE